MTDEIVGWLCLLFFGGPVIVTILCWIFGAFLGIGHGAKQLVSAPAPASDVNPSELTNPQTPNAPEWMLPAGVIALVLAVLGFIASAAVGGGGSFAGSLLAGAMNPLFFMGGPLGLYWLRKSAPLHPPAISDAICHDDQPNASSGASGATDESVHADVAEPSENTRERDDSLSSTSAAIPLIAVVAFLGLVLFLAGNSTDRRFRAEQESPTQPTRDPDPETVMFNLVTEQAAYNILRHVDRPFDLEFGKPIVSAPPDDLSVAIVLVECTYAMQDAGVVKTDLFMVLLENTVAPAFASSKDQLNCLLVNAGGAVLSRDDDYWDGFSLDFQRQAGAVNTGSPPFMAKTMWDFQTSILPKGTTASEVNGEQKEPVVLPERRKHPPATKSRGSARLWRDVTGRYSINAAFVAHTATTVTLKKQDGTQIVVDISRLSESDQEFLWESTGVLSEFGE